MIYSIISLIFFSSSVASVVEPVGRFVFSPAISLRNIFAVESMRTSDVIQTLFSKQSWKASYREAQLKIRSFAVIAATNEELLKENTLLREQLELQQRISAPHLFARVSAREEGLFFTSFTIDKGSSSGIKESMAVAAYKDGRFGLIGKVSEVFRSSSLVVSLKNDKMYVSARIQKGRHEGLAHGNKKQQLVMDYVVKTVASELSLNDLIVTSGIEASLYPAGIPIGRISHIIDQADAPSLTIILTPVIEPSEVEIIMVFLEKGEGNNG